MKKQVYNPYLPLYEYVPDGEPHVFGDRVYVYGSHDQYGAFAFCHNDYITWSASVEDLKNWRYEGIILKRTEDPDNKDNKHDLYAPDVCQGPDGKYYIYYAYDWLGRTGVAVSDKPTGPFKFLGHVHDKNGVVLGCGKPKDVFQFDPGVLVDDDKRVYLYSGFGPNPKQLVNMNIKKPMYADACWCIELEPDMVTVKEQRKVLERSGINKDPAFLGHEFFEASSPRKINGKYYVIYSSILGHELCYAFGDSPWGPFKYGGTIVSNGDVGLNGRPGDDACYPTGNNHGGLAQINGEWYVFYHRHTNFTNTDRQGMAEKITINPDGTIPQVEMTSCGLNGGPLEGKGTYPATICCCLKPKKGNVFYPFFRLPWQSLTETYITQSGKDSDTVETQYIHNVKDGTLIGYKYFDLTSTKTVTLEVKGRAKGKANLLYEEKGQPVSSVDFDVKGEGKITLPVVKGSEKNAVYIQFANTKGKVDAYKLILK